MENEWVKVEDRLPDYGQLVVECRDVCGRKIYGVVLWSEEDETWMKMNNITKWIALPIEE